MGVDFEKKLLNEYPDAIIATTIDGEVRSQPVAQQVADSLRAAQSHRWTRAE
jgi:hypothetical protein